MSGLTRSQAPDLVNQGPEQEKDPQQRNASNQNAIDQLQQNQTSAPDLNVGEVESGTAFAKIGSQAIRALVPGPGSFASLKMAGKVPIPAGAAISVFLEPILELQIGHTNDNDAKYEVMFSSQFGIGAKSGTEGSTFWPAFLAYFKGYAKGSIKITGDSPEEIFDLFMLTVRLVIENACIQAGATDSMRDAIAEGVMSGAHKTAIIDDMDKGDGVTVAIGGGVEAGAKTPVAEGKAGAELSFSRTLQDQNDDDRIEMESATSLVLSGEFTMEKWGGFKLAPSITFIWKNGVFDSWEFAVSGVVEFDAEKFQELFVGVTWAQDLVNSLANMIKSVGDSSERLDGTKLYGLISGISITDNLVQYSAFGSALKSAAQIPGFKDKFGQKADTGLQLRGGWSKEKGAMVGIALSSSKSWTLGEEGSPLFIEAKTGDTIFNIEANSAEGVTAGT